MRKIINLYHHLLKYPDDNFHRDLNELVSYMGNYNDETLNSIIQKILPSFQDLEINKLKELYSHTFDWNPSTCLYVGYYLFGESYFRSTFLIKLREVFENHNFSPPLNEMPDHYSILLDFSANHLDDTEFYQFLETVLLVSLDKFLNSEKLDNDTIEKSFTKERSYYYLLKSLHYLLSTYISKEIIITTI